MGDVLSIIEKAQTVISENEMKRMEENFRRNAFTLEDFLQQYDNLAKMGNLDDILENLGGAMGGKIKFGKLDEQTMARNKAIIQSMTMEERVNPDIIKSSRKQRIAQGSGTSIQAINQLLKQFEQGKTLMKQFGGNNKMMRRFR